MKVQITLDDKLMERIDCYADENYMSRSGLISVACTKFLNEADAIAAIKNVSFAIRKIADEGKLDDDTRHQLEDFERICKIIISNK